MKNLIFILTLILLASCTPGACPELTMRKPNYYDDLYLTYIDRVNSEQKYDLYTGRCSTYQLDTLTSIRQYKEGYDHGKWKFYYKNGQIETSGEFDMGKRIGKWKYYYENGNLMQISQYNNGDRVGHWFKLDISGDTIWSEKYSNNKAIN